MKHPPPFPSHLNLFFHIITNAADAAAAPCAAVRRRRWGKGIGLLES